MKKLCRIDQGKKICGVCGGLAEYINVDPTVIRLAAVLLSFISWGSGIIVYIIAAIIMPVKE